MRNRGHSLIELGVGLVILLPLALIMIDLIILVIGMEANDSICREAARIAASDNPATVLSRVMSVIDAANSNKLGMVSNFRVVDVKLNPADLVAQAASLRPYGGTIVGSVTVSTVAEVHPFIVQWVCANGRPMTFASTRSFPFTYLVPNTAAANTTTVPSVDPQAP